MRIALVHVYQLMLEYGQRNERAQRLKNLLSTTKSSISNKTNYPKKRAKPSKIQLYFSWYHYDVKKERYTQVREQQGGGLRVQHVDRHSTFQEMFQWIVDVFFPNGFNKKRKYISKYKHCLGDYALQEMTETMYLDQEVFTLEKYIKCNSLKQVKFTLLTCDKKDKKNKDHLFLFNFSDDDHDDYDDFKDLPPFSIDNSILPCPI